MRTNWISFLSAFGVPLLGLGLLLVSLWHPNLAAKPTLRDQTLMFLQQPNSRFDKTMSICLSAQAKSVAHCRAELRAAEAQPEHSVQSAEARWRRAGVAQSVDEYNLIARECTPAVFQTTHLPPYLAP